MFQKLRGLYIACIKALGAFLSLSVFIILFAFYNFQLATLSRTFLVVVGVYTIVYVLMTKIYGGYDIGVRKSKPIVFSQAMCVFIADLAAHLFLCIMNYTVVNNGRFVYEHPLLLLFVFIVQLAVIILLAYCGNDVYFYFTKPVHTLLITNRGEDYDDFIRKINVYKKQYRLDKVVFNDDKHIYDDINDSEVVFIYNLAETERYSYIQYCYRNGIDVYFTQELSDIVSTSGEQAIFTDVPLIFKSSREMKLEDQVMKRIMDLVISAIGLVITSPIFLFTAIAIKLDDGGKIFYTQKRVGKDGKRFRIIKFRSMKEKAGNIHESVTKDDDRITRVGHFIRKFRIDELPQLINVLIGDMSIVGPRPEMEENYEDYVMSIPDFAFRQKVKAGLTGYAQVYGKYNTSPKDKLMLDLSYIENYSIVLDIKIILRTVLVLFTPDESTEGFDKKHENNSVDRNV